MQQDKKVNQIPLQINDWQKRHKRRFNRLKRIEIIIEVVIYFLVIFVFVFCAYVFSMKIHKNNAQNPNDIKPSQNPSNNEKSEVQKAITIPDDVHNANTNKQHDEIGIVEFFMDSKNNKEFVIVKEK